MAFLEVRDLRKYFPVRRGLLGRTVGWIRAVDGVSLTLDEGETLGLVGESGCGKSTLVQTILFLERPTSGEIRFLDRRVTERDVRELRRRIQVVFQDPYTSLPPRMRVADIVADPLRIHGHADEATITAKVRALLQEVGLPWDRRHQYPFQFSGGQRQRIGIARALAIDPSLVLADEAVSALDVSVQAQILNLFRDLQERHHLTYIFVSHDLGVVRYMSRRIAVMYVGKIVELAPSEDLSARPLHPYTRALLSAVPSLERRRERIRLRGEPPKPTDPPSGCAFHPRCPIAQAICARDVPELREWLPGRYAACHFALAEGPGADAAAPRTAQGGAP
ncbi:MAG TPA: ABC transporter ATP-binding protein [Candidatus Limnocylindria bacterium]|nr:ABC transporter ATP-binding protein [Candidatus Limnocylindria bacterium]